jgi:hypothetical protein
MSSSKMNGGGKRRPLGSFAQQQESGPDPNTNGNNRRRPLGSFLEQEKEGADDSNNAATSRRRPLGSFAQQDGSNEINSTASSSRRRQLGSFVQQDGGNENNLSASSSRRRQLGSFVQQDGGRNSGNDSPHSSIRSSKLSSSGALSAAAPCPRLRVLPVTGPRRKRQHQHQRQRQHERQPGSKASPRLKRCQRPHVTIPSRENTRHQLFRSWSVPLDGLARESAYFHLSLYLMSIPQCTRSRHCCVRRVCCICSSEAQYHCSC